MILEIINPGYYEVEVVVKEIIYGSTIVDKYIGLDEIEYSTLKLRCEDCTIMVFKKNMSLFYNIPVGFKFKAQVSEWKTNIYHFKKFVD